jgi:glycerol uptake facilitator-like aquaporin
VPNELRHGNGAAFLGEFLFCFAVVLVSLAVQQKHREAPNSYFGLASGGMTIAGVKSLVSIGALAASFGASRASHRHGLRGGVVEQSHVSKSMMNPAVTTALAMASTATTGTTRAVWLYWVSDISAGAIAAIVFVIVYRCEPSRDLSVLSPLAWSCRLHSLCLPARWSPVRPNEEQRLPIAKGVVEFIGTFFLTLTAATASYGDNPACSAGAGISVGFALMAWVRTYCHEPCSALRCGVAWRDAMRTDADCRPAVWWRRFTLATMCPAPTTTRR